MFRSAISAFGRVRSRAAAIIVLGLVLVGGGVSSWRVLAAGDTGLDLALVLAIDCSFSVDSREFQLQMAGLARAFRDPEVQAAIARGPQGRIAVAALQWADDRSQTVIAGWTILDGPAAAERFARLLESSPRQLLEGGTAIGAALLRAAALFDSLPMPALRKVIDISSDGRNNVGPLPALAREAVKARAITINALVIVNEWPNLDQYFAADVIGGEGAFVIIANDYEAYAKAMIEKLLREMTGPGTS